MRILFFIECLHAGGKERRLVELIKGLSKRPGMEMEIVLTKKEIHYKDVFSSGIKIHYAVRKNLNKDPRVFLKFYKIAKEFQPNIIHVWGNLVALYALPAKILLRIPMINNQITDAPLYVSSSLLGPRLTFKFSDRIIANSLAGLKSYKAPKNKSEVIYNGFDLSRIAGLEDKSEIKKRFLIKTDFVVGMVASFTYKKDYDTFIKAAKIVLKSELNISFLCIGSGDNSSIKEMVNEENNGNILFLGKQNNVESIMNICDVGVLMTNKDVHGEGISNALLEFCSLGKPVIANFGGGTAELIEQGLSGYLIESKSPEILANKILHLYNNKKVRMNLGTRSKQIVIEKFGISRMIDEFQRAYLQI